MARPGSHVGGSAAGQNRAVVGYDATRWTSFFVAEAGAAAALSGLLFVAVSINLDHVLAFAWLPGRAGETIVILVDVLLVATLALVPGQSRTVLGIEITVVALLAWLTPLVIQHRSRGKDDPAVEGRWRHTRAVTTQLATVPFVLAGFSLLAGWGGGLYWTVPGVVLSFATAVFGAWILLVEIMR